MSESSSSSSTFTCRNGRAYTKDGVCANTLHLSDIDEDLYESDVEHYFTQFGRVYLVEIPADQTPPRCGYVTFTRATAAYAALKEERHTIFANRVIATVADSEWQVFNEKEDEKWLKRKLSPEIPEMCPIYKLDDNCLFQLYMYLGPADGYSLSRLGERYESIFGEICKKSHKCIKVIGNTQHSADTILKQIGKRSVPLPDSRKIKSIIHLNMFASEVANFQRIPTDIKKNRTRLRNWENLPEYLRGPQHNAIKIGANMTDLDFQQFMQQYGDSVEEVEFYFAEEQFKTCVGQPFLLPNVRSLKIAYSPIQCDLFERTIPQLCKLREVELCDVVICDGIIAALSVASELSKLRLRKVKGISGLHFEYFKSLKQLYLERVEEFDRQSFTLLCEHVSTLRGLEIVDCNWEWIGASLRRSYRNLTYLKVSNKYCSLRRISKLPGLRELHLIVEQDFDGEDIFVRSMARYLNVMVLQYNGPVQQPMPFLTIERMECFARLTALNRLVFIGFNLIDDDYLRCLVPLTNLKGLQFTECRITGNGIWGLQRKIPGLDKVGLLI